MAETRNKSLRKNLSKEQGCEREATSPASRKGWKKSLGAKEKGKEIRKKGKKFEKPLGFPRILHQNTQEDAGHLRT